MSGLRLFYRILIPGILILVSSCSLKPPKSQKTDNISSNTESSVKIDSLCLNSFYEGNILTLKRYLVGNIRWDYRVERGKTYAFIKVASENKYCISPRGFYNHNDNAYGIYQTRVVLSFYHPLLFDDRSNLTLTNTQSKSLDLYLFENYLNQPGYCSYLVIEGGLINIEIFEQSKTKNRSFTQRMIKEVNKELKSVLEHQDQINEMGVIPENQYNRGQSDSSFLIINDGPQPGIYFLQAAYNPSFEGEVWAKVFEVKSNMKLSSKTITPLSTKKMGWSNNGTIFFPYQSEIKILEGAYSKPYDARFELWFRDINGNIIKIAEKVRPIKGWDKKTAFNN